MHGVTSEIHNEGVHDVKRRHRVYLCLKNSSVCGISSLWILSVESMSSCSCCKYCILCRIIVEFIGFLMLCLSSGAVRYVLGVYLCLYSLIFEGIRERTE